MDAPMADARKNAEEAGVKFEVVDNMDDALCRTLILYIPRAGERMT